MSEEEAGRYGDKAFTQMVSELADRQRELGHMLAQTYVLLLKMYAKVVSVQLINALGYDVLFQDVDLVS